MPCRLSYEPRTSRCPAKTSRICCPYEHSPDAKIPNCEPLVPSPFTWASAPTYHSCYGFLRTALSWQFLNCKLTGTLALCRRIFHGTPLLGTVRAQLTIRRVKMAFFTNSSFWSLAGIMPALSVLPARRATADGPEAKQNLKRLCEGARLPWHGGCE